MARRTSGFADTTTGATYPAGYYLPAPDGSSIPGDCPAAFREEAGRDWLDWVEEERARIQAEMPSGVFEEWNARGIASSLSSAAGGAWAGPAARIASLVSEETGRYWSEVAPRMNRTEYVAHRWARHLEEMEDMHEHEIATYAADLATMDETPGTRGLYRGMLWELAESGWSVIARDVPTGGGWAAALESLRESGAFTATMLQLCDDTFRHGATGRKGRVIAPAGDFDAAIARAAGACPPESKRGRAVAAARALMGAGQYRALEPVLEEWAPVASEPEPF